MPGIPIIREVTYTDDGCTLYQCLSCKEQIESRSSPVRMKDKGYTLLWKHCPYCGVHFKDFMPCKEDQQKYYDNPRARTDRIYPCMFVIEERWIDDNFVGDWIESQTPFQNPVYLVRKLKEVKEFEKEQRTNWDGSFFEYRIRKV